MKSTWIYAVLLSGLIGTAQAHTPQQQRHGVASACQQCGKVTSVRVTRHDGQSNAAGVVGGGVVGALLGNQVGSGSGKAVATVAGAVGGAYAGKKIQERARRYNVWTVNVRYDNGRQRAFRFKHDPGVQRGDRVRSVGQSIKRI